MPVLLLRKSTTAVMVTALIPWLLSSYGAGPALVWPFVVTAALGQALGTLCNPVFFSWMGDLLPRAGLTEVLGQKVAPAEASQNISSVENLDVLTRGDTPPNPSELLLTPALGETLEWASQSYDTVIVDSPPVLAVTVPVDRNWYL